MERSTQADCTPVIRKGKHLNFSGRQQIERWLRDGVPVREIVARLNRNRSTIIRERKRGLVIHVDTELKEHEVYSCERAQDAADMDKAAHESGLKIGSNTDLVRQLVELLTGGGEERLRYSPYAARQALLRRGVEVPFSARTIYNYIYNSILGETAAQLVQGSRKKRRKLVPKRLAHTSTDIENIEERPEAINKHEEIRHYEMDCVVGSQGSKAALLVLTERRTRFEIILLLAQKTQECVKEALDGLERRLGAEKYREIFKSKTTDNGSECGSEVEIGMSCLDGKGGTILFHAHPYRAGERGSNENVNRLIRRIFPKGTSFDGMTQETMDMVAKWINCYPRKIFNGLSAWEMAKGVRAYFKPRRA